MKLKKALSLVLAGAMTLSLSAPALAAPPEGWTPADGARVAQEPWYAEAQAYVTERGLMTGTDKGFEATVEVTYATVLQTLYNMEGRPNATETAEPWFADAAAWWADFSKLGYPPLTEDFLPVRGNVNSLLGLYAEKKGFSAEGLMVGNEKGDMMNDKTLTRAEFAQVLMRLDARLPVVPACVEETVSIEVKAQDKIPAHTVPGTLCTPADTEGKKLTAVVMLHGTGSNRHEAGNGYAVAAPIMAGKDIVTLRIDFMGSGDSTASYTNYNYTSASIDAKAAADYLATLDYVDPDKIAVLGWSQGGTNALLAAKTYPDTFKAVITWSGALDLTGMFEDFDAAYAAAKKSGSYEMTFDWREPLKVGERWFKEVKETDVRQEIGKSLNMPVLAINGDKDDVVPMQTAFDISNAVGYGKNGYPYVVEGADHTYNVFSGDLSALTETVNVGIAFLQDKLDGKIGPGYAVAVSKYGNVGTDLPIAYFDAAGYEVGDILKITVGDQTVEAPYGTGYSNVDTGNAIALEDTSNHTMAIAINMGNFAKTYNVDETTPIYFSMGEKAGYLEEYEIRNIDSLRSNDREDYESDETFANFRNVTVGEIAEGVLYRSSSPVNPELGRNTYSDALIKAAGIKTVLNLADSQETMEAYEGYAESYYSTLNVIPLNMGVDFAAEDFAAKLKTGLQFLLENDGPYLVHCTEGKDRAGFVTMLLEAFMGGTVEEIKNDYMLSFRNYYYVEPDSDRWNRIAASNVINNLMKLCGVETEEALAKADLEKAAETYLEETVGLSAVEIKALKDVLAGK